MFRHRPSFRHALFCLCSSQMCKWELELLIKTIHIPDLSDAFHRRIPAQVGSWMRWHLNDPFQRGEFIPYAPSSKLLHTSWPQKLRKCYAGVNSDPWRSRHKKTSFSKTSPLGVDRSSQRKWGSCPLTVRSRSYPCTPFRDAQATCAPPGAPSLLVLEIPILRLPLFQISPNPNPFHTRRPRSSVSDTQTQESLVKLRCHTMEGVSLCNSYHPSSQVSKLPATTTETRSLSPS